MSRKQKSKHFVATLKNPQCLSLFVKKIEELQQENYNVFLDHHANNKLIKVFVCFSCSTDQEIELVKQNTSDLVIAICHKSEMPVSL
jgi:hypothetical protein